MNAKHVQGGSIQTKGSQCALPAQLVSSVELETHVTSVQQGHTDLRKHQRHVSHVEKTQRQTQIGLPAKTVTSGSFPQQEYVPTVPMAKQEMGLQMMSAQTAQ